MAASASCSSVDLSGQTSIGRAAARTALLTSAAYLHERDGSTFSREPLKTTRDGYDAAAFRPLSRRR